MESKAYAVALPKNPRISIQVIPGHFSTNNAHTSHYLDLSYLKSDAITAKEIAQELALPYLTSRLVDTIVCMEGTEVIGAFLAEELLQDGTMVMNMGKQIRVITPKITAMGQLVFHSSAQEMVKEKRVLVLVASVLIGTSIYRVLDCIRYYGGILTGISALFSAVEEFDHQKVNALFSMEDIPDYRFYLPGDCQLCQSGLKLDALIDSDGYTKI